MSNSQKIKILLILLPAIILLLILIFTYERKTIATDNIDVIKSTITTSINNITNNNTNTEIFEEIRKGDTVVGKIISYNSVKNTFTIKFGNIINVSCDQNETYCYDFYVNFDDSTTLEIQSNLINNEMYVLQRDDNCYILNGEYSKINIESFISSKCKYIDNSHFNIYLNEDNTIRSIKEI